MEVDPGDSDIVDRFVAGQPDACDPLAVQQVLATAMLTADAPALGIYYVDDHFVPNGGAKPVGKGWNTKRKTAMPGHGDTLLTDHRGRAVAFLTGEPSGLTKTLPPVPKQLRQILGPDAPILLGFDRGGGYASVFTECRTQNVDWITYRRGKLTPTTTTPQGHTYIDGHGVATRVLILDEQIEFPEYGTCRQLPLFEQGKPVLQILTSDQNATAAALLIWLRARWRIENAFKDLAHNYGIDWLRDYTADLIPDTTAVANPARTAAKKARDQAKTDHETAQHALAALSTSTLRPISALNKQITTAHRHLTKTAATLYVLAKFAHCFKELRQPNMAEGFARRSLDMDNSYVRGRAFNLALLATTHAQAGQIEEACSIGTQALDLTRGIRSARALTYLRDLLHELEPSATAPTVISFKAAAASVLTQAS